MDFAEFTYYFDKMVMPTLVNIFLSEYDVSTETNGIYSANVISS